MKLTLLSIAALLVACSQYNSPLSTRVGMIGKQTAISIANQELARRRIVLPQGAVTKIEEGTINVEVGPDVPIYSVSFYAPNESKSQQLYSMGINRWTGIIEDFTDPKRLIPAND